MNSNASNRKLLAAVVTVVGLVSLVGCMPGPADFHLNMVYVRKMERSIDEDYQFESEQTQNVSNVVESLFGDPDDPHIPTFTDPSTGEPVLAGIVDEGWLERAAGPVSSDETGKATGLYREHCVHCHGISGDGMGPTAQFLNPYPRDFRPGRFKFTSTPVGKKPTHEDLRKTLMEGIPGTAMPSFKLLSEDDFTALLNYLKYLSIRGEVERKLIYELAQLDVEEGEQLIDLDLKESEPGDFQDQEEIIKETVSRVANSWRTAENAAKPIPEIIVAEKTPQERVELAKRGRELFHGAVASCAKCHGSLALGDGQTNDYDEWTKELEPDKEEALEEYLAAGALPPRNIRPRNLRLGVYRGGRRPEDLYYRIANGIDGTPMPAALIKPDDAGDDVQGLTNEDIRAIIEFVRGLPYEEINRKPYELENKRERS